MSDINVYRSSAAISQSWVISSLKPNSITLAGSNLVADRFEAKLHYTIWFEASNLLRITSFEPDSVMEFGFYQLQELRGWPYQHLSLFTIVLTVRIKLKCRFNINSYRSRIGR